MKQVRSSTYRGWRRGLLPAAMLGYATAFLLYMAAFIAVMALTMSHHPAHASTGTHPHTGAPDDPGVVRGAR